jgi:hypothetical protein
MGQEPKAAAAVVATVSCQVESCVECCDTLGTCARRRGDCALAGGALLLQSARSPSNNPQWSSPNPKPTPLLAFPLLPVPPSPRQLAISPSGDCQARSTRCPGAVRAKIKANPAGALPRQIQSEQGKRRPKPLSRISISTAVRRELQATCTSYMGPRPRLPIRLRCRRAGSRVPQEQERRPSKGLLTRKRSSTRVGKRPRLPLPCLDGMPLPIFRHAHLWV